MAKKKNVVIRKNALEPTTLATVNNKKTGFIGLILLFAIFIGVVYFLPNLSEWYENYKTKDFNNAPVSKKTDEVTENNNEEEKEEETEKKYTYSENPTITNSDISISNFVFLNGILKFDVTNLKDNTNDLTDKKYYLNIFNGDTLVKRIKVAEASFNAKETKNYEYSVNTDKIDYFTFSELSVSDYPEVSFINSDNPELKCIKEDESITYMFVDNKLTTINDIYTVNSTDPNYQEKVVLYQNRSNLYNSIDGITITNNVAAESTIITTSIDLKVVDIKTINNINYYALNTIAKEINFEMEARGFDCQ